MSHSCTTKPKPKPGERGFAIYATIVFLVAAIPMTGLAIDGTMLYIVKTRLQGAVDGAALAAAKALARGIDDPTQTANARLTATTYVMLNYPVGFFFTSAVTCDPATDVTIDLSVAKQRTVTVVAHANVPTLFMRWLHFTSTNVNASAQTVRRDVNIALVIDRSGSLQTSGSCGAVRQAATNFVNKFSNGRDYVSLVTFATSTHADFPIANNFLTASPNVPARIGGISCAGYTSSAMGLWTGYDQLVRLNQPAALNVILFFTDGKPNTIDVNMPIVAHCTSPHPGTPNWINGAAGGSDDGVGPFHSLFQPTNNGTITNGDTNITTDGNNGAGCVFRSNSSAISDFAGLPLRDIFGSNLDNGYQSITSVTSGGIRYIAMTNNANGTAAGLNSADDAALQIRNGTFECANSPASGTALCASLLPGTGHNLPGVFIYSIGLDNSGLSTQGADFLRRVANDPASSSYNSSLPAGAFFVAPTTADIDSAFAAVASEILRLAK